MKKVIVEAITKAAFVLFILSVLTIESMAWLNFAAMLLSGAWLVFYAYFNGYIYGTTKGGDENVAD